jgi:hypothetical protein
VCSGVCGGKDSSPIGGLDTQPFSFWPQTCRSAITYLVVECGVVETVPGTMMEAGIHRAFLGAFHFPQTYQVTLCLDLALVSLKC